MSEPKFDRDDPDAESMFDFLAEEGTEKHRRKKRTAEAPERSLPIIRKPVPVSESGPLLPPKPGAPVEPPPALTSGAAEVEDDLDFLSDVPDTFPEEQPRESGIGESDTDGNISRLDPRSRRLRAERDRSSGQASGRVRKTPVSRDGEFDDLELDLEDAPEFNRHRKGVRAVAEDSFYDDEATPRRGRWLVLALVLIATGAATFLIAFPDDWRALVQKFGSGTDTVAEGSLETEPDGKALDGGVVTEASPMMQRFREQLGLVEGLIADGALDDAEQALSSMDRTVYGYGAAEFGDLGSRIEQLRSGVVVADPAAEQAGRDEAVRGAAEPTAQAERALEQSAREADAKAAAGQAARDEEARIASAAEQAAQESQVRVAAENAARVERDRVAAQQAEQARLTAEKSRQEAARLEQERQQEQARLAALEARTSDWPSKEADRQATDRRIAAERAAVQRQQAREQRLIEARQRETALAAQAASKRQAADPVAQTPKTSQTIAVPAADSVNNGGNAASETRSIGDDELQTVYRRFIDLQQAVSSRDINAVVGLTQRSGARVQQLMQIFENSTQIDARIRNVSTSNATGQIKGTLQINRIKRADGTFVEPPSALSSIPLSSQREGDGWSAIAW